MSELNSNFKVMNGSEKNFGLVMSTFFILLFLFLIFVNQEINYYLLIVSLFFLTSSFFYSSILKIPNKAWFYLGLLLGKIISPILMLLIYVITFIPTSFIFRIMRKDLIKANFDENLNTYWQKKDDSKTSMKNQF
jgi:K+ transporter